jgi:hypothetical protein
MSNPHNDRSRFDRSSRYRDDLPPELGSDGAAIVALGIVALWR